MKRGLNWSNYKDVYDIFKNGTKIKRSWGRKASIELGEALSGSLFGESHIEVVNIFTGEIIYTS